MPLPRTDPNAGGKVAKYTLISCKYLGYDLMTLESLLTSGRIRSTIAGLGLTTSTIYAFATRQPAVRTALQTSLNTGLTAASFFGWLSVSARALFNGLTSKQLFANI